MQRLPQPIAAGGHGENGGPHQQWTVDPGHRRGLVRAGLSRVRLYVWHACQPVKAARRIPSVDSGTVGSERAKASTPPVTDLDRRGRRKGHVETRGAVCEPVERVWTAGKLP